MSNTTNDINVSPERLRSTAQTFLKASQDTSQLVSDLSRASHQLVQQMSTILRYSPGALDILHDRWSGAMNSLSETLQKMSANLEHSADSFEHTDQHGITMQLQPHHGQ